MLKKREIETILTKLLSTGSTFSEVFIEKTKNRIYKFNKGKIEEVSTNYIKGIGLRAVQNNQKVYACTNNKNEIDDLIDKLIICFKDKQNKNKVILNNLETYKTKIKIPYNSYPNEDKKKFMKHINEYAKSLSNKVFEVEILLKESTSEVTIANSNKIYRKEVRNLNRLFVTIYVKENDQIEFSLYTYGTNLGYESLMSIDIEKNIKDTVENALSKLSALPCPSGEMEVVIGSGFGGVIFHEACGHGLEATSVSKGLSIFANDLGNKISNECVTLIDNGTNKNAYGTTLIDDEGNITKENILIDKGVLKSYLVDFVNKNIMNHHITSSGRRESYKYPPTSRMHNTYIAPHTDKFEDIIKSIKYGLYAKSMGGGSVNPPTGDFNFSVRDAFMIRNGKIEERVTGASLIGNGKDVLKKVSMVSDDLCLDSGICGSISGRVPVTVGQPTIKVDKILVGGSDIK